jgi:CheY-like chemotaxis protein
MRFLESARRRDVSCLVTDMRMPGMTGLELFQELVAADNPIATVLDHRLSGRNGPSDGAQSRNPLLPQQTVSPEQLCSCVRSAIASGTTRKS